MKKVVVFVLAFSMLFGSLCTMAFAQELPSYESEAEGESVSEEIITAMPDEAETMDTTQGEKEENEAEDVTEDTEEDMEDNEVTEEATPKEAVPDEMENGGALDESTLDGVTEGAELNTVETNETEELGTVEDGISPLNDDSMSDTVYHSPSGTYYLHYTEDERGIVITLAEAEEGYYGNNLGEVSIPDQIDGKPVYRIGDWAFGGCSGFTGSLIVPEGVTSIGDGAFTNCTGFTGELKLPSSLTEIGNNAFAGCSGFTGNLKLPERLTSIGQSAFWYCKGFTGDLILPDSLTIIEAMTFADCTGFNGRLKLPANVTVIEDGAFMSGFETIETAPGRYTEVKCGYVGDLVLPDTLTRIGSSAFKNCSSLTGDLKLPSGLTEIEDWVFYDCNGLTGILELPEGLITIGDFAFGGCQFTGELKLPDGLKEIKSGAFWSCEFTGDLRIPDSVERIGDQAFIACNSLSKDIYLSGNITSIENDVSGRSAFERHGISNADIMIHAPRGSYAETYAIENGYSYTDDNGYVHVGTGTASGADTNNNTSNTTGSDNASHNNGTTLPNSTVPIDNATKVRIAVLSALEDVNKAAGIQSGEYLQVKVSDVGDDNAITALSNYAATVGVKIAAVFDIVLQVMSQEGTPVRTVSELTAPITFTIAVPEGIDGNAYEFGVLLLHGNEITFLPDLDNEPSTITFAADRFSVYAIVYGEKGSLAGIQMVKDSVPKTGDVLPVAIPAVITLSLAVASVLLGRKKGFEKKAERMRNR